MRVEESTVIKLCTIMLYNIICYRPVTLEINLRAEQETIKSYRERILQAERAGEFALSETLRDIIAEEQDHEIDLKDALGLR